MAGGWSRRLAASPTMSVSCWEMALAILVMSGEPESGGVVCRMWERASPALSRIWASWPHSSWMLQSFSGRGLCTELGPWSMLGREGSRVSDGAVGGAGVAVGGGACEVGCRWVVGGLWVCGASLVLRGRGCLGGYQK